MLLQRDLAQNTAEGSGKSLAKSRKSREKGTSAPIAMPRQSRGLVLGFGIAGNARPSSQARLTVLPRRLCSRTRMQRKQLSNMN